MNQRHRAIRRNALHTALDRFVGQAPSSVATQAIHLLCESAQRDPAGPVDRNTQMGSEDSGDPGFDSISHGKTP